MTIMSPKTKYILEVCAGLVAIMAIGIAAIVLLRAKRTSAPEILPPQQGIKKEPVTSQGSSDGGLRQQVAELRKQQFGVPSESSSVVGTFGDLPESLRRALTRYLSAPRVFAVVYDTGQKGYRLEEDSAAPFVDIRQTWQDGLLKDKLLLSTKNNPVEMMLSAKVEKYRFVVTLSKLTERTTGQAVHIIEEK